MNEARGPAYRIITKRLILRCWEPKDAALLKASIDESLEHLLPWMIWAQNEPQTIEQKVELIRLFRSQFDSDQDYSYAIFNLDQTRALGGTGLHKRSEPGGMEIGYWIHKDFVNQGFATEASAALTKVAFEVHKTQRLEIYCAPENVGSAAVPRKLGFTHEATLHNRAKRPNGFNDSMIWTLFAEDYSASLAANAEIEAFDAAGQKLV